jgi:hypothetical protein
MLKLNEGGPGRVWKEVFLLLFKLMRPLGKSRFFTIYLAILTMSAGLSGSITTSATEPEDRADGEEVRSEETVAGLPAWEEGDFREGFDVRIWPERIVMWLEQENLRDLIADPRTPGPEKEALKKVLAMQQVWPKRI